MTERIVVVGFGPVAARLVEELLPAVRSGLAHLMVIGEEAEAAYNRVLVADLGVGRTTASALALADAAAALSFRNLPKVQIIGPGELNAYDVLCNEWVVFTKEVLPAGTSATAEPADTAKKAVAAAEGSASDEAGDSADQESAAPTSGEAESKDEQ